MLFVVQKIDAQKAKDHPVLKIVSEEYRIIISDTKMIHWYKTDISRRIIKRKDL